MPHSRWSRADIHIHTTYSDGADDVPSILEYAARHTEIRILAITDHDCLEGALEAHRLAPAYGLQVIIGQEVSTNRGHVLGLYLQEGIPCGLSIPETVALIHAQGGLAVLAHPFDRMTNSPMRHRPRPRPEEWGDFDVDAIEACNGCQMDPQAGGRAVELGRRLNLALTGGSDAHHKEAIGTAYTLFWGHTADDLRRALESGSCRYGGEGWTRRDYLSWLARSWWPRARRTMQRAALSLAALHIG
ncbi:MAG: CehA/McbA family metallohydrolase [Chloroflexi bacterium]|nr:CehA/McbA family metallohydrolase [Chloroflexota bacterium]